MADPTRRIEAWRAKADPERTRQVLAARHADMQRRYEAAMADLCANPLLARIRTEVLDTKEPKK